MKKLVDAKNILIYFILMIFSWNRQSSLEEENFTTTNESQFNHHQWMKEHFPIIKNMKITQISVPGTHHSFYAPSGIWKPFHERFSRCQSETNPEAQFKAGIRLFDLRIAQNPTDKDFYMSHRFISKTKLSQVFEELSRLVKSFPSEIVLIFLREDFDNPLPSREAVENVHLLVENAFSSQLIPKSECNSRFSRLLQVGNVIVFGLERVESEFLWDFKHSFIHTQHANPYPEFLMEVLGDYLGRNSVPLNAISVLDTVIGLNQWNFYLGIANASAKVNQALMRKLLAQPEGFRSRGNAFLLDYFHQEPALIQQIIQLNFPTT